MRKISNWGVGLLLAVGAVSRVLWGYGGPDWSYWLGNLAFAFFFMMPGIAILFAPRFAVVWMQSFGGAARGHKLTNWDQLGLLQKLVIYAFAFMDLVIGAAILLTNLYRLLNNCPPSGDCSGL